MDAHLIEVSVLIRDELQRSIYSLPVRDSAEQLTQHCQSKSRDGVEILLVKSTFEQPIHTTTRAFVNGHLEFRMVCLVPASKRAFVFDFWSTANSHEKE